MAEIRKQNPELDEIDTRYKRALRDDAVWIAADRQRKAAMTHQAIMDFAVEQGEERGIEKGIAKGIEKGKELGRSDGRQEELIRIVSNMQSRGNSVETIADATGKSVKEIEAILGK